MKDSKKTLKKIFLKKETISNLSDSQMNGIIGGDTGYFYSGQADCEFPTCITYCGCVDFSCGCGTDATCGSCAYCGGNGGTATGQDCPSVVVCPTKYAC